MDNDFKFWYPVKEEEQPDFEGRIFVREILCEGHILYQGRLMCGETMEVLKNKIGVKKDKTLSKRGVTPKMCPACLDAWKAHPESAYYRWKNGYAVHAATTPTLNPALTGRG